MPKTGKKATPTCKRTRRTPCKAAARSAGLDPKECLLEAAGEETAEAAGRVEKEGGVVIGSYRDPLGGHPLLVAVLRTDKIEPTPFQRDLSQAHHKRLAGAPAAPPEED